MMKRLSGFITSGIACVLLVSCAEAPRKSDADLGKVEPPIVGWRLPKTVLDVTVTYTPIACRKTEGTASGPPLIDLKVTTEVVPRAVPDLDLGPDFPNGLVQINKNDLRSFWTDTSVGYSVYPDSGGILKSLSSHPVNQTGAIIGNVLTGIVKIAGIVAASTGSVEEGKCGNAFKKIEEIKKLKLRIPGEAKEQAEDDAQRIVTLRDSITIAVKKTVDTTVDLPNYPTGLAAQFAPNLDDEVDAGWKTKKGSVDPRHVVYLLLDFNHGILVSPFNCPDGTSSCSRTPSHMSSTALFRQAAYIPIVFRLAKIGADERPIIDHDGHIELADRNIGKPQVIIFGQYGIPRTLPLKSRAFRDKNWGLDFSQTGEIISTTYAAKATGAGVSSVFSEISGAASDTAALKRKSAAAVDTDTLRLEAENERLKAETDNHDLKVKLEQQNSATPSD